MKTMILGRCCVDGYGPNISALFTCYYPFKNMIISTQLLFAHVKYHFYLMQTIRLPFMFYFMAAISILIKLRAFSLHHYCNELYYIFTCMYMALWMTAHFHFYMLGLFFNYIYQILRQIIIYMLKILF